METRKAHIKLEKQIIVDVTQTINKFYFLFVNVILFNIIVKIRMSIIKHDTYTG